MCDEKDIIPLVYFGGGVIVLSNRFGNKLHKDRENVLSFCRMHRYIYIYGIGDVADMFFTYLTEEEISISGFIVSDGQKKINEHLGYPVGEMGEFSYVADTGIIVAVSEKYHKEIAELIMANGVKREDVFYQKIYYPLSDNKITLQDAYVGVEKDGHYFSRFNSLDAIGTETGTDKCSLQHDYLRKYELFLQHFKDEPIMLMELGVFHGESLKMWENYFQLAQIVGVDINHECKKYASERTEILTDDLSKLDNLNKIGAQYQPDIIVEDASHLWSHQIKAFVALFPYLQHGGIYIMEDIGTNFGKYKHSFFADSPYSAYDFMSALADLVAGKEYSNNREIGTVFDDELVGIADEVDMITFIYGSIVVVKK